MNLTLKFKNIQDCNGLPRIRIVINDAVVFENEVCPLIPVQCHPVDNKINLSIEHYGKDERAFKHNRGDLVTRMV